MDQVIQIVGALLILVAYGAAQMNAMDQHSRVYLVLNLTGAVILAVLAWFEQLWGFLMLETVWAGVSLWGLLRLARGGTLSAGR
ncbi:MAG: hypothetical protein WDZ46_00715 [Solirubrobacterales bacterium]